MTTFRYLLLVALVGLAACSSSVGDHHRAGFAALKSGDYATAETEFKTVLQHEPNDPHALLNLGAVYQNTGRTREATALYRRAIAVGAGIYAQETVGNASSGQSLADIARRNLRGMGVTAVTSASE